MATTMATTTTVVGGACARRTPHGGGARVAFARQSRLAHTTRTRARIDSKDPWWEKPCPENMKECESTMEFLNLLVRACVVSDGCFCVLVFVVVAREIDIGVHVL